MPLSSSPTPSPCLHSHFCRFVCTVAVVAGCLINLMVARGRPYGSPTPPTVPLPIVLSVAVGPDFAIFNILSCLSVNYHVIYVLPIYLFPYESGENGKTG